MSPGTGNMVRREERMADVTIRAPTSSYGQILRSTLLIGGSSVVTIAFAILRNKVTALLLGPQGVGLMALYTSILDLAQVLAGLGLQSSGVRQIAEAAGSGDRHRIAVTAAVLRWLSIGLGLLGLALLAALALPLSWFSFGDGSHRVAIVLLSGAVLLRIVSGGQTALLQGLRRIADLARINILAAMLGSLVTVALIYRFREAGIVPSLIAMAAISVLLTWLVTRRLAKAQGPVALADMRSEAGPLVKLGFAFLLSGLLTTGSAYAVRIVILHLDGVATAGLYQAAWTLGGLYAGFILQAMGTDFYPRLTAIHTDNEACNRLVNEQAEIGLLLAAPGLVATLTLAPAVMTIFYSAQFQEAAVILRWICLGMMLRIVSWPLGYLIVAKGARRLFVATDAAAAILHVGLVWLLLRAFGPAGAGAAFLGLYLMHGALVYGVCRHISGFRWSRANIGLIALFVPAATAAFAAGALLPLWQGALVGSAITLGVGLYCLKLLLAIFPDGLRNLRGYAMRRA
jgi:PST family polysaccharide transporter